MCSWVVNVVCGRAAEYIERCPAVRRPHTTHTCHIVLRRAPASCIRSTPPAPHARRIGSGSAWTARRRGASQSHALGFFGFFLSKRSLKSLCLALPILHVADLLLGHMHRCSIAHAGLLRIDLCMHPTLCSR